MTGPAAEREYSDVSANWLRPAVFGAMDGLVSNFALIMGVAGGTAAASSTSTQPVILAGIAGLAAGAFSMAAGEYTSVASQAELAKHQIELERLDILNFPEAEEAQLAEALTERGVEAEVAGDVARQLHADPEVALRVHAMVEMGINPDELASPKLAAVSSFLSFAVGALIPLLPYLFGVTSPMISIVASLLGLFLCGAVVTRVTAVAWWYGGMRQLVLGAAAASLTYLIGSWIGG